MSDSVMRRYSIQLDEVVGEELEKEAAEIGLEPIDHMAGILTAHALPRVVARLPELGGRLEAAARIKAAVSQISRRIAGEQGIQRDHTLRVFQAIRQDPQHAGDYRLATGCETGFEAGNPLKHRLNLALGAISKNAAGAKVRKVRKNDKEEPEMIRNIRGEFCGSVTVLGPDDDDK
jgi:hypothetical protein